MDVANAQELLRQVWAAVGQSGVDELMKAAVTWGAMGAGVGFAVALTGYFFFRLIGWYTCATTGGRWAKRGMVVLATLFVMVLGGVAGAGEGVRRHVEPVITNSKIGKEMLPPVADFFASTCVWLDLAAELGSVPSEIAMAMRVDAFRSGRWELDVPLFFKRIETLRTETLTAMLGRIEEMIHQQAPALKEGPAGEMVNKFIHEFGPGLLDQRFAGEMNGRGLESLRRAIRDGLLAEAARAGDPAKIQHAELSGALLRQAVVPGIVMPIDSFVRQQQMVLGIVAVCALVLPAIICRIFRGKPAVAPVAGVTEPQPVARAERT